MKHRRGDPALYFSQRDIDEVAGLITVAMAAAVAARRMTTNPQVVKALDLMIEPFKDMISPALAAQITEVKGNKPSGS